MADEAPSNSAAKRGGKRATPPGHVKVFKTAVFKIHNPSKRKRAMLIDSMKRAHLAYERLLNRFMPDKAEIERLSKLSRAERREAMKPLTAQVIKASRYPHLSNNAKDAIRVDALAQIASTIGLQDEQEEVGLPTVTRINAKQTEYEEALRELISSADLMDENAFRAELLKTVNRGKIRPLNFVRHRREDGFLLLRDPASGRLGAWLNLHSARSRFAERIHVHKPGEGRELIDLKTGEFVSFSSATGERFAIEMGHAFHDQDFLQVGEPQTARLYWRRERDGAPRDDLELHVIFQFIVPKIEPITWMGVDRGIYNLAAYSVIDDDGRIASEGRVSGMNLRFVQRKLLQRARKKQKQGHIVRDAKRRAHADEAVHVTANALVEAAHTHRAQIVLENLRNLSGIRRRKHIPGTRRGGFNALLNRTQYEKLKNTLTYKLKLAGLPVPIFVWSSFTSVTCPECSHSSDANRKKTPTADGFAMDIFACVECGHTADADENAARIIAMKGRWLTHLPKKKKPETKLADELRFDAYLRDAAERRMGA